MASEITSLHIRKLSHPLKDIRERSLLLIIAKLNLGWCLEDELSNTRELIDNLLAWFYVPEPTLQREALKLLLTIIKTQSGTYIANEIGVSIILTNLSHIKSKIDPDAMGYYEDVIETLKFLNTVTSEVNLNVPPLTFSSQSSESVHSCSTYYSFSAPSSMDTTRSQLESDRHDGNLVQDAGAVRVLLFPWVELCPSDRKTLLLIEDALKLFKSTRRSCRFIRDVFLRDFPAETFLNRPTVVKGLLSIAEGSTGVYPGEALQVLLCISRALRARLLQLSSLDLIHDNNKVQDDVKCTNDTVNSELEMITGDTTRTDEEDDRLLALRQLPAPLYALDTMHAVLSTMGSSIVQGSGVNSHVFGTRELNLCLCNVECLIELLLDCVSEKFWTVDCSSQIHRDIANKSCMVMRLLGDLLTKYRISFKEDPTLWHCRVASLRLASCAARLLRWARDSALPPSVLISAIQTTQIDPVLHLNYPDLLLKIDKCLQYSKNSVDEEYKSKYRELTKLYGAIDDAAKFMKSKGSFKSIFDCISNSLPTIELHSSETYLDDIAFALFSNVKDYDMSNNDWSLARSILLNLMSHKCEWVQVRIYKKISAMVNSLLVDNESNQSDNEKCLIILCDVAVLTEICCHGICSKNKEVEDSSTDIMLFLMRGRLVLSDSCWYQVLASLLPILPLLHVYAAHDTPLGKAISKSLERGISDCMGVPITDVTAGWVRLLFVRCLSIQLDASHALCRLLDDENYLPPKESLRADVLLTALRKIKVTDFNVDNASPPNQFPQTTSVMQILDVLKQDLILDEYGSEFVARKDSACLDPDLRRNTLQQLAVLMQQPVLHETFDNSDGLKIIIAILRMSLLVDDFLVFPECAFSCVSILNSVCFENRHNLFKIQDLPLLLIRVILIFPSNESAVVMAAQVLALTVWSGFILQERNSSRRMVPSLPHVVTQRTLLPFEVNSYWIVSTNVVQSSVEWLLSDEDLRAAIRVRWWCACEGGAKVILGAPFPPAPLTLQPTENDLAALRTACPNFSCSVALLGIENATSHKQVINELSTLESYIHLLRLSSINMTEFGGLPWKHMLRYIRAPPASSRDTALLTTLLQFIIAYMDNVPRNESTMAWIKSSFIDDDASVIALLSRQELYPQQTVQESIEVTQLQIQIVKVILRCIIMVDEMNNFGCNKMESLIKILMSCLKRIDMKNFHSLGFLNELLRCIRYALHSKYCKLPEETSVECLKILTKTLGGCTSGGGRKGQASCLDTMLSILAVLHQIHKSIPVQGIALSDLEPNKVLHKPHDERALAEMQRLRGQHTRDFRPVSSFIRWSESWSGEVTRVVLHSTVGARVELRAAALLVMAVLAHHAQLVSHLVQAVPEGLLTHYAAGIFADVGEANVVRTAAAVLIVAVTSRTSSQTDTFEHDILEELKDNSFLEKCLTILSDFCHQKEYVKNFEPNVPISLLERKSELEVLALKGSEVCVTPSHEKVLNRVPPTASLVASIADILYNVSAYSAQEWNGSGIYRLLFRCASWSNGPATDVYRCSAASCRALAAAAAHRSVRAALCGTQDCLHNLLLTIKPFADDETNSDCLSARAGALLLIATLLPEKAGCQVVWKALREGQSMSFLHSLLQSLRYNNEELQTAGLYCLTQLAHSMTKCQNKKECKSRSDLFDIVKSPFSGSQSKRSGAGDTARSDCMPEFMAEELCKNLIKLYQELSLEKRVTTQEEGWSRVCSCLSSVLAASARCRAYALHRQLPRMLVATLQQTRDRLMLQGSVDAFKSANNSPILHCLYWVLTVIDCTMLNFNSAKESFAEDILANCLNRLWPWCMLTVNLRDAVMHLLQTFSNNCPKAWSSMSSCVGMRSLTSEVCTLGCRESSRPRSDTLLLVCLRTLRNVAKHHLCRTIIQKSDIIASIYKQRVRDRHYSMSGVEWARLVECVTRHADGAGSLLALRPLQGAAAVRARLMAAVAHVATHRRANVLQATDLLELISGTLLVGETAEVVEAARAVWALAANNYKAKLLVRSVGIPAAVQSAIERLQQTEKDDDTTQRALQILTYTHNVLQTT